MHTRPAQLDPLTQQATLQSWFSPFFPTGGFAFSHGLETAIASGTLRWPREVAATLQQLLENGACYNDLVLATHSWHAAKAVCSYDEISSELADIANLAVALCSCEERLLETCEQGASFLQAALPWVGEAQAMRQLTRLPQVPLPVVAGAAAACCVVQLQPLLVAYAHSFCANLIGVIQRALPMGQQDALTTMQMLGPYLKEQAQRAEMAPLDALGSCALVNEIAAMAHAEAPTRIYRS
ncbi:urease accessory protein UreF [Polycladidibacter hongkongensis]|uniref:urease accessory protein UreF n=1 Tax=Polycladidibacter hongkongensis TaxID=1647556 RepID=UPI00082A67AA|nr:urease accessory UreF family protein [Pseudovibrio hongkongensis]